MIWFIISVITGAALFDGMPHEFSSNRHFATEADCVAYLPSDAAELEMELLSLGLTKPYRIIGHCELDPEAIKSLRGAGAYSFIRG